VPKLENEIFSAYLICSSSGFFHIPVKLFGGNFGTRFKNVHISKYMEMGDI
jgi:hypothetical protein